MASSIYSKLKATNVLPSPSPVAMRILQVATDENATISDVAALVESDPATASRLLRYVNSPIAGVSRRVGSIPNAVALLGLNTVKGIALGFSLMDRNAKACERFHDDRFWSESIARALGCRRIVIKLNSPAADEAFACGLLSQIGRLSLAIVYPVAYSQALLAAAHPSSRELRGLERQMFGIDHCELAAEMMAEWNLPSAFSEAVRLQHAWNESALDSDSPTHLLARTLHLAGTIAQVLVGDTRCRESLSKLLDEGDQLGIAPRAFETMFDSIVEEWRVMGKVFAIETRTIPPFGELYPHAT